ncbi:MAG TPA: tetratricopeptide repeat protein [Nocardioidaceae bacterium]|nr:tetratricopeptide repeat protein [Nocardioidaceae bacterium]
MSMPFSRPGAIDLSGLKNRGAATPAPSRGGAPAGTSSYSVDVDEGNFQSLLEQSMAAPVLLVAYSPSRMPESARLAEDLATLADEFEGKYLLGKIDIDAQPGIAQAMQLQSVPLVAMVLQGRLQPLFQSTAPIDEIRALLAQLGEQLATQGMTGRHQPLAGGPAPESEGEEEYVDPRYAPAEDALVAGDLDTAVEEYQKLIAANPADTEAVIGLARAKLMQRTASADLNAARAAAAANADDVDAQILVADLDLLGGHVDDAFNRLIDVIRRTAGDDRDRVRVHLIELFTVVGDDPRVLKARQNLANALF